MHKHQRLLHKITLISSAVILSASLIPLAYTTATSVKKEVVKANVITNDDTYVPLDIQSGLDAKVIMNSESDTAAISTVDAPYVEPISTVQKTTVSCWYTSNAHSSTGSPMPAPDADGNVTIPSTNEDTPNLSWKIPNVDSDATHYNALRIFNNGETKTLTFNNLGVYNGKLYLLVTAANQTTGACTMNVKINYADGKSTTTSFSVEDWCSKEEVVTPVANRTYNRALWSGNTGEKTVTWNESTLPRLYQCAIDVVPTKLIKNIEITKPSDAITDMVLTVYGVSGILHNIAVPTNFKVNSHDKISASVSWDAVAEATNGYAIDVTTDPNFGKDFVYLDKKITSGTSFTITDLLPGKTYYTRLRAIDASDHQSASCTAQSFTTDAQVPSDFVVDGLKTSMSVGEEVEVITSVKGETISGKTYIVEDQSVTWTKPSDITITESESGSGYKKWKIKATKGCEGLVSAKATQFAESRGAYVTVKPNAVKSLNATYSKEDNEINISWDKVDNIDSYGLTVSKNKNFTDPIYSDQIDKDTTSITITEGVEPDQTYYVRIVTKSGVIDSDPTKTTVSTWIHIKDNGYFSWWIVAGPIMGVGMLMGFTPFSVVMEHQRREKKNKK